MLKEPKVSAPSEAIRSVHQVDTEAFAQIYRTYSAFVHGICLRMLRDHAEAEDAAQDVFVRVFLKIGTFRGESAFSSWLYRLATNVVLMRFRASRCSCTPLGVDSHVNINSRGEIDISDPHVSDVGGRIDLEAAIELLPDGYKAAFILHDVQGYRHKEIAAFLGCSTGGSKSQLHKARRRLRELLVNIPGRGRLNAKLRVASVN